MPPLPTTIHSGSSDGNISPSKDLFIPLTIFLQIFQNSSLPCFIFVWDTVTDFTSYFCTNKSISRSPASAHFCHCDHTGERGKHKIKCGQKRFTILPHTRGWRHLHSLLILSLQLFFLTPKNVPAGLSVAKHNVSSGRGLRVCWAPSLHLEIDSGAACPDPLVQCSSSCTTWRLFHPPHLTENQGTFQSTKPETEIRCANNTTVRGDKGKQINTREEQKQGLALSTLEINKRLIWAEHIPYLVRNNIHTQREPELAASTSGTIWLLAWSSH